MQFLIMLILLGLLIYIFVLLFPIFLTLLGLYITYRIIRYIRKNKFFKSERFLQYKDEVDYTVKSYNEIADYVKHIPNKNQFIPTEKRNEYAHLATFENTSTHNYRRDRNIKTVADNVYPASLQVVRRASEEPIKYLCKYFNIKATQDNLEQLQEIGENISRMENTIENLKKRQKKIEIDFNPPKYIMKYYQKELMDNLGVKVPKINVQYAKYIFEYTSSGGNSSQESVIIFDGETVEAVSSYVSEKIKYNKSAAAQRTLMTSSLRNKIKERDNYTCQMCSASIKEQNLLLLEIDHIIPVSKGGLSTPDNLQVLCWKCNRSKSNKIITEK